VIALLNPKQEAFCLHYAKTGNATESYKKAGYACKNDNSAGANARRLLLNDKIKARLQELAEEAASSKIANIAEIQQRLTEILRMSLEEDQVVVEGCGDGISEAKIIKRKAQLKDVLKAGELLAKMQGGFDNTLKVEMTVPVFGGEDTLED
jgi:phage terminase small subunit